jgi:hypothetical protein
MFQSLRSLSLHLVLRAGTGESAVTILMSGNLAGIARSGRSLAVLGRGGVAPFKGIRRYIARTIALAERLSERRRDSARRRHQRGNEDNLRLIDHGNSPADAADNGVTPLSLFMRK